MNTQPLKHFSKYHLLKRVKSMFRTTWVWTTFWGYNYPFTWTFINGLFYNSGNWINLLTVLSLCEASARTVLDALGSCQCSQKYTSLSTVLRLVDVINNHTANQSVEATSAVMRKLACLFHNDDIMHNRFPKARFPLGGYATPESFLWSVAILFSSRIGKCPGAFWTWLLSVCSSTLCMCEDMQMEAGRCMPVLEFSLAVLPMLLQQIWGVSPSAVSLRVLCRVGGLKWV